MIVNGKTFQNQNLKHDCTHFSVAQGFLAELHGSMAPGL